MADDNAKSPASDASPSLDGGAPRTKANPPDSHPRDAQADVKIETHDKGQFAGIGQVNGPTEFNYLNCNLGSGGGGATNVVGAGTVFLTQNAGNESFPSEQTLEQKLHQFRQMPSFTRAPEEEVRKYTDVLKDNQIIAVRGYSVYDRAPREAALSLIECLNDDKKLRIFESRSNSNIAIDSLPKEISKQEDFRDSVLLIDARRVQDSATSLRDMLVDQLVGAARDAQCYVVILVSPVDTSVDGKDTPDDADRCPVWVVGVKPPPVSASDKSALADKLNDPVDAAILLTATVFSGLDPMEFCAVVDALLPPLSPKAKTKEAPQREPASLERWRRGEHDSPIEHCGLSFGSDPEGTPSQNEPSVRGYFFTDPKRRTECHEFIVQHAPYLFVRHLQTLTERYYSDDASNRFCVEYRRYVVELHMTRIHALESAALAERYLKAVGQGSASYAPRRFVALLQFLSERSDFELIVRRTLSAISEFVQQAEAQWQCKLLEANYSAQLSESKHYRAEDIVESLGLKGEFREIRTTLRYFFDLTISMALFAPTAVGDAICECMAGSDFRAKFFAAAGFAYADGSTVPSVAVFDERLTLALRCSPFYWLGCARAALQSSYSKARTSTLNPITYCYLFSTEPDRRAMAYTLMLGGCLNALAWMQGAFLPNPEYDEELEALLGDRALESNGNLLADIATTYVNACALLGNTNPRARQQRKPVDHYSNAFGSYCGVASLLMARSHDTRVDGGRDGETARKLNEFVAPLAQASYRELRAALLALSRARLELARTERRRANDNREAAAASIATTYLHAAQDLLRALKSSGDTSRTAGQPSQAA
jgi:hypothetical protein